MTTHRWIAETPRIRPDGTWIEQGETFAPTPHELRTWPGRIETAPTCGAETADGTPCENPVDAPGERCWQHETISDSGHGDGEEDADGNGGGGGG